jgi:PHD/YefM family antitoxin component YafN of YafNO toxin-antitoxin module
MDRYLNVTEARKEFPDLVEQLQGKDRLVIPKRGRPRVVLVNFERYALLEDLAWVLQEPGRRAALHKSWDELQTETRIRPQQANAPTVDSLRKFARRSPRQRARA